MNKYNTIIFDLDGTLLNTSVGIINSVKYVEEKMKLEKKTDDEIKKFIGPPILESYKKIYYLSEKEAKEATIYHREYSAEKGIYEAQIYEKIEELLKYLKQKGYQLAVATLKEQLLAEKILKYFGLNSYFEIIVGAQENNLIKKVDVINYIIDKLAIPDRKNILLIGDSKYDAIGAKDAKIDFIGITYGFGFKKNDKIQEGNVIATVDTVNEIKKIL